MTATQPQTQTVTLTHTSRLYPELHAAGEAGLPVLLVDNALGRAVIALQGAHVLRGIVARRPLQQNLPFLCLPLAPDESQHRGLASAGGPHQRGHLAAWNAQRHVVQNDPLTVPEGQVANFDKGIVWDGLHECKSRTEPGFLHDTGFR